MKEQSYDWLGKSPRQTLVGLLAGMMVSSFAVKAIGRYLGWDEIQSIEAKLSSNAPKPNEPKLVLNKPYEPNKPAEPNYAANSIDVNDVNIPEPNYVNGSIAEPNIPAYATRISQKGLDFIKQVEGFSPKPYPDADGFSIGHGHFILPGENYKIITEEKAEELLKKDAGKAESAIAKYAVVPLTQQQYDTLVSFVYNVGEGRFAKSTLLKKLNEGNYERVSREIERWNKGVVKQDKGYKRVVLGGLVDRRKNEIELFNKGDYAKD